MPKLTEATSGWYCYRALPKKEHLAARLISNDLGIETYCPRLSRVKRTRTGKRRFVEALFPCYFFINGNLAENYRKIQSIAGVRQVLSYGDSIPEVPIELIQRLKDEIGEGVEPVKELPETLPKAGDWVRVTRGALKDFEARVLYDVDAKERVFILLDILGQEVKTQLQLNQVIFEDKSHEGI